MQGIDHKSPRLRKRHMLSYVRLFIWMFCCRLSVVAWNFGACLLLIKCQSCKLPRAYWCLWPRANAIFLSSYERGISTERTSNASIRLPNTCSFRTVHICSKKWGIGASTLPDQLSWFAVVNATLERLSRPGFTSRSFMRLS